MFMLRTYGVYCRRFPSGSLSCGIKNVGMSGDLIREAVIALHDCLCSSVGDHCNRRPSRKRGGGSY
jgi:hypothetical protein